MTLPIWKRQALYVLWYEDSMYDAWCGRGTETARNYHMNQCELMIKLIHAGCMHEGYLRGALISSHRTSEDFSRQYATMQTMCKDLAAMICRSKDSLSYYNYVESGHVRCSCFYEPDDKVCRLEWSYVPTQSLNWYWKRNICSINSMRKSLRCGLHNRVKELSS